MIVLMSAFDDAHEDSAAHLSSNLYGTVNDTH